jgi:ribosomal protein S12 methylthiotransferase
MPATNETNLRVSLLSLGCPKNLVDSERVIGAFVDRGLVLCPRPEDAEVVVVNTCGFLQAAKEESLDTIREMVALKNGTDLRGVVVAGCLVERDGVDIKAEAPGVDAVVPFDDYDRLLTICREVSGRSEKEDPADYRQDLLTRGERVPLTPGGSAYLKISEGCNNPCSFCTIPAIKGKQASRPAKDLIREATNLAMMGTKELVVVGQDTTFYGFDLDKKFRLAGLMRDLGAIPGIEWVRLLYAYPAYVTDELLEVLAGAPGVLPYMDIPLQHIADGVLRRMKRPLGGPGTRKLMDKIRERVPGIVLRTTVITGAPGESDEDFEELLRFVEEFRFERLGCFTYSPEADTPLGAAEDQVTEEVREERRGRIMEAQQRIAFEDAAARVGDELDCLVESTDGAGRTWRDAPEIDTQIEIRGAPAAGIIGMARVTKANDYDLEGEWIG